MYSQTIASLCALRMEANRLHALLGAASALHAQGDHDGYDIVQRDIDTAQDAICEMVLALETDGTLPGLIQRAATDPVVPHG